MLLVKNEHPPIIKMAENNNTGTAKTALKPEKNLFFIKTPEKLPKKMR